MRFATILLLKLYVGVTGELIVQLSKTTDGRGLVNISFPFHDVTVRMLLSFGGADVVPGESFRPLTFVFHGVAEEEGALTPSNYTFENPEVLFVNDLPPRLALSPSSQLLRNAGSVAMVHSSANNTAAVPNLVIGSLLPSFSRSCEPGSMMAIQLTSNDQFRADVRIGDRIVSSDNGRFYSSDDGLIAMIPHRIYFSILAAAESAGARWVMNRLSSCSQAVIESLPVIEIIFPEIGQIVIFPDEYMQTSTDDDTTCRLSVDSTYNTQILIDPFKIPGFNFRVSQNRRIEICDAAAIEAEPGVVADPHRIEAVPRQSVFRRFLGCIGRLCTR